MVWLILLAVLCALPFVPIGIYAVYRENDPGVWLLVGPLRFRLYPKKESKDSTKSKSKSKNKLPDRGGSHREFASVFRAILDFLGQLRKKVRVRDLELKITLAGDDPCNLALNYGRAWAAVGTLSPLLDQMLVIKRRDIAVDCDFEGDKTRVYGKVIATITLGRAIHLIFKHGKKLIKELLELKKLEKGGAQV